MRTRRAALYGIGSANMDAAVRVSKIAREDQKTYILAGEDGNGPQELPGGVTLNHLTWAAALGTPTAYFGYQGDDRYGELLRSAMDAHGVDRSHLRIRKGKRSGSAVIFVDPGGERAIYMSGGTTADISAADIERDFLPAIQSAGIVSTEISLIRLSGAAGALRAAKRVGALAAVDVDVPPSECIRGARLGSREEIEEILQLADIVKPSKSAAAELTGESDPARQAEAIRGAYGAQLTAVTDGSRGCVLADEERTLRIPAKNVRVADATGAGDAFFGGLLAGAELPLEARGQLANACGAACCAAFGAQPIPDKSMRLVRSLYEGAFPL